MYTYLSISYNSKEEIKNPSVSPSVPTCSLNLNSSLQMNDSWHISTYSTGGISEEAR